MSENTPFKLYCCGSRGTRPIEGRRFNEFGGYTSCYILKKDDYAVIIDCGTGLYAGNAVIENCTQIDVLITHMHYDHILGLLNWNNFPKGAKMTFYAGFDGWFGMDSFKQFFSAPFWPYCPDFNMVQSPKAGIPLKLKKGLSVEFYPAPHPNNAQLMIIRSNGKDQDSHSIAVMFDTEFKTGLDIELIRNCDLLIYDGTFTDEEYLTRIGYGHSTWSEGARFANEVNCGRLIITHHDPDREDADLRSFEKQAREIYPQTDFARAGQSWDFPMVKEKTVIVKDEKKGLKKILNNLNHQIDEIILDNDKLVNFTITFGIIIAGLVSIFMTIVNIVTGKTELMYSTMVFSLVCLLIGILQLSAKVPIGVIKGIFSATMIALFTFFVISGTPEGFSALWCLLIPTATMTAFGRTNATICSAVMLFILVFFLDTGAGQTYLQYDYTESFRLRFPMAFVAFYCLSLFLETVRSKTSNELKRVKTSQEEIIADQTSELRDQNFRLLNANSSLAMRNRLLNKTFGRNLANETINDYLDDPDEYELAGGKCSVTMMRANISGFSGICDSMDSIKSIEMLNNYLDEMTDIVQKYNGTIIEYIGDAILAVFGAPVKDENHADDAIAAAIDMQRSMKKIAKYNKAHGFPCFEIQIGLHSGDVVIGTIGTENHLKYDAVGSTCKTLFSIESYSVPGMIVASEATINKATTKVHRSEYVTIELRRADNKIRIACIDSIGRPYTLSNIVKFNRPHDLKEAVNVEFKIVEGYNSANQSYEGKIISAEGEVALLQCSQKLNLLDRIRIDYNTGLICKVVDILEDGYLLKYVFKPNFFNNFDD